MTAPQLIDVHATRRRRAAARAVTMAYATSVVGGLVFGPVSAGLLVVEICALGGASAAAYAVSALAMWVAAAAAYGVVVGACVYFAPRRPGHELWSLRTNGGAAALVLAPDRRRGALPDDVKAFALGAWPKGHGVGRLLGNHVLSVVHGRSPRARLTLATLPALASVYRRAGFVDDGPALPVVGRLVRRMASRPRPPSLP